MHLNRSPGMHAQTPTWTSFRIQTDVVSALMPRDMQTPFESPPAFLIAVLWPLAHIAIIVGVYTTLGSRDWLGSDPVVFTSIGVLQFVLSLYIVRWVGLAIMEGKLLLRLPRVKTIDLLVA